MLLTQLIPNNKFNVWRLLPPRLYKKIFWIPTSKTHFLPSKIPLSPLKYYISFRCPVIGQRFIGLVHCSLIGLWQNLTIIINLTNLRRKRKLYFCSTFRSMTCETLKWVVYSRGSRFFPSTFINFFSYDGKKNTSVKSNLRLRLTRYNDFCIINAKMFLYIEKFAYELICFNYNSNEPTFCLFSAYSVRVKLISAKWAVCMSKITQYRRLPLSLYSKEEMAVLVYAVVNLARRKSSRSALTAHFFPVNGDR